VARLAPGQFADLAVLSADYFSVDDEQIKAIESVLTVMDGEIVFAQGPFSEFARRCLPSSRPWQLRLLTREGLLPRFRLKWRLGEMRRKELPGSVQRGDRFVEYRIKGLENVRHCRSDVEGDLDVGDRCPPRETDSVVEENLVSSALDQQSWEADQIREYRADEAETSILSRRVIRQPRPTIMAGLTRAWRKTGHSGRGRELPTVRPAKAPN
jgi:hypothetical protein